MRDLQAFIAQLESSGELHRISATVSPLLEVTEIADRLAVTPAPNASPNAEVFDPGRGGLGGPALLFESVEGCDFPLAINLFGSYSRIEMALGNDLESIAARIGSLVKPQPPRSLGELVAKAREFAPLLRIPPRTVRNGICREVIKRTDRDEVDLTRLPIIKCWPLDGDPTAVGIPCTPEQAGTAGGDGRFITLAGMHTIHADDREAKKPSSHNIGMYRAQLLGPTTLAMHWHLHHDGAAHWRSWKKLGKPMPIAIALGGESVMPYAATAPLPPGISELLMAGFLNGRGIRMVRGETVPIRVPANAEIVIEGYVRTDAGVIGYDPRTDGELGPGAVFEGPFGDHTGFYSMPDRYPILEVTAITHRRGAIYPTTVVGLPPQEDYYLGKATERIFLPLLKTIVHDIDDYHLPRYGCFHNAAFVRIHKAYPLQARRVMHSIWGAGQMAWTKSIVVVDEDVPVHDEQAVIRTVMERCDFRRDLEFANGPLDILDHAAPRVGSGTKIGFDATHRFDGEQVNGLDLAKPELPNDAQQAEARRILESLGGDIVAAHLPEVGLGRLAVLAVNRTKPHAGIAAIEQAFNALEPGNPAGQFIIAIPGGADPADLEMSLFHWISGCDPGRDLVRDGARIGFDATTKVPGEDDRHGVPVRDYPPILRMDDEIIARVDAQWQAYGFSGEVPASRSSDESMPCR
ncbi:MAG: UbiD family decarboxylase [Phycisphaerales bacterium]|nr:UbiD family decarboxylase [Phycisphaerales bacterium]